MRSHSLLMPFSALFMLIFMAAMLYLPLRMFGGGRTNNAAVADPAPQRAQAKKHLLLVTYTAGFRHSSIGTPEKDGVAQKVIANLGEKSGLYDVEYCRTADDVKKMLTVDYLKNVDAVFFVNTTNNLGIPDLPAFLNWIKEGHAFLGAHAAADTYKRRDNHGDASYVEMIGGEFKTHGQQSEVEITNEDKKFPAVANFAPKFKIKDEIYEFNENDRKNLHVLLSMDKHPNDGHKEAGQPGDYLVSWCKEYGKGKVFYTSLGHREDVWESEAYQQHLLGALRWAFGKAKGDAKPQKK